jgi:hypothetical protein
MTFLPNPIHDPIPRIICQKTTEDLLARPRHHMSLGEMCLPEGVGGMIGATETLIMTGIRIMMIFLVQKGVSMTTAVRGTRQDGDRCILLSTVNHR